MSVTGGYFASLNGNRDRLYDPEQMSRLFQGLILDGVLNNIGHGFSCVATDIDKVKVSSGFAYYKGRYVENSEDLTLTIPDDIYPVNTKIIGIRVVQEPQLDYPYGAKLDLGDLIVEGIPDNMLFTGIEITGSPQLDYPYGAKLDLGDLEVSAVYEEQPIYITGDFYIVIRLDEENRQFLIQPIAPELYSKDTDMLIAIGHRDKDGLTVENVVGVEGAVDSFEYKELSDLPFDVQYLNTFLIEEPPVLAGGQTYLHALNVANYKESVVDGYHYRWDGNEWTKLGTMPCPLNVSPGAVLYNNAIHLFYGQYNNTEHYWWNLYTNTWNKIDQISDVEFGGDIILLYNNEIHLIWEDKHYKWTSGYGYTADVSTLPYIITSGYGVVYDDKIHIFGGYYEHSQDHYCWDYDNGWVYLSELPLPWEEIRNGDIVVYDDKIHIFTTPNTLSTYLYHYTWNGEEWIKEDNLDFTFHDGSICNYKTNLEFLYNSNHYELQKSGSIFTPPIIPGINQKMYLTNLIHSFSYQFNKFKHKWKDTNEPYYESWQETNVEVLDTPQQYQKLTDELNNRATKSLVFKDTVNPTDNLASKTFYSDKLPSGDREVRVQFIPSDVLIKNITFDSTSVTINYHDISEDHKISLTVSEV